MFKSPRIIKLIIEWLVINFAISIVLFTIIPANIESPNLASFWHLLLRIYIISASCVLTGNSIGYLMRRRPPPPIIGIPIMLVAILCVAIAVNMVFSYLLGYFLNIRIYSYTITDFLKKQIMVVVITVTITALSMIFGFLRKTKEDLENDLRAIKDKINRERAEDSISIKLNDGYCLVQFDDLIYLSSHGKKTTFHTKEKDYTASYLLKDIEEKLPDNRFIRIHRQYIINTKYLREMRYYEGGRYMVYLNDEDETMLPVGRNIALQLKEKFAI